MGFGGISIWQLLIILVIIVLLFGTKRLRNIGTDLGSAIRGFRNSIKDGEADAAEDATFPADTRKDPAAVSNQTNAASASAEAKATAGTTQNTSGSDKN